MRVLEAIRTADAPALIPAQYIGWAGDGDSAHAVIGGIEDALERATAAHATFSELGLPWARPAAGTAEQPSLTVRDRTVQAGAQHSAGQHARASTRRPARRRTGGRRARRRRHGGHPAGRNRHRSEALTPALPASGAFVGRSHRHRSSPGGPPWHLGAGIALQDVNGVNFWGGKTYTRASRTVRGTPGPWPDRAALRHFGTGVK